MRGLASCLRVFGGRPHFSASLTLLAGGGSTLWLTWKGAAEEMTRGGADDSLLSQQLDRRLALADSLQTAVRFRLAAILSAKEAQGGKTYERSPLLPCISSLPAKLHSPAVADLLHLINRLKELHNIL